MNKNFSGHFYGAAGAPPFGSGAPPACFPNKGGGNSNKGGDVVAFSYSFSPGGGGKNFPPHGRGPDDMDSDKKSTLPDSAFESSFPGFVIGEKNIVSFDGYPKATDLGRLSSVIQPSSGTHKINGAARSKRKGSTAHVVMSASAGSTSSFGGGRGEERSERAEKGGNFGNPRVTGDGGGMSSSYNMSSSYDGPGTLLSLLSRPTTTSTLQQNAGGGGKSGPQEQKGGGGSWAGYPVSAMQMLSIDGGGTTATAGGKKGSSGFGGKSSKHNVNGSPAGGGGSGVGGGGGGQQDYKDSSGVKNGTKSSPSSGTATKKQGFVIIAVEGPSVPEKVGRESKVEADQGYLNISRPNEDQEDPDDSNDCGPHFAKIISVVVVGDPRYPSVHRYGSSYWDLCRNPTGPGR